MKVTYSNEKITAFGGFNFCHDLLTTSGIYNLIDRHLGQRANNKGFNYSDIFASHFAVFLNGGNCTEDVNTHLRESLKKIKNLSACSADTILREIKELATPTNIHTSDSGVEHQFNVNLHLNTLLIKALKATKQLETTNKDYILDYDNQVIEAKKYDAKKTYKRCYGYQSGVASIGKNIVYIEGRNGNSPAKYLQHQTLTNTFDLLDEQRIKVKRFRADSASYQEKVIDLVSEKCSLFYIRATRSGNIEQLIGQIPKEAWEKERLGTQEMELADIIYTPFHSDKSYRLVVSRIKRSDHQIDAFSKSSYTYRSVLTNDYQWSNKEITAFYNQRASSEKNFDSMNNDFGWGNLPCSFLNENTSFMIMTALYSNLYQFILNTFSDKLEWLKPTYRLKKFIFRFITVPAKWVKTGRQEFLKLYTNKDYSPIIT